MLIDQDDPDVFSFFGEFLECRFDGSGVGLAVDNEEVLLRIGASGDVLRTMVSIAIPIFSDSSGLIHQHRQAGALSLSPASLVSKAVGRRPRYGRCLLTSSPMTARNWRSLKSACDAMVAFMLAENRVSPKGSQRGAERSAQGEVGCRAGRQMGLCLVR